VTDRGTDIENSGIARSDRACRVHPKEAPRGGASSQFNPGGD
jgi:hypothetical protein